MTNFTRSLSIILASIIIVKLFSGAVKDKKLEEEHKINFINNYNIYSIILPKNISFASEKVPLNSMEIYQRLDREFLVNTYWQSQGILLIKKSNKYFPIIEPILKRNNIPDDLKYLAVAESGLSNVISPSGAHGFWQILKETGLEYGLEINSSIDERYHLEKATQAACDYLNNAYEKFGNWTLAAAAYNMGINGVKNQLEKQQVNNYYDLYLNEETSRYVFRIIALKDIMSNPKNFGFNIRDIDLYQSPKTTEIKINYPINNLANFAKKHNTNYKTIKILNPWLTSNSLPNKSSKTYIIKLSS